MDEHRLLMAWVDRWAEPAAAERVCARLTTPEAAEALVWAAADAVVRRVLPLSLRASGLEAPAQALAALAPLRDRGSAREAERVLREVWAATSQSEMSGRHCLGSAGTAAGYLSEEGPLLAKVEWVFGPQAVLDMACYRAQYAGVSQAEVSREISGALGA